MPEMLPTLAALREAPVEGSQLAIGSWFWRVPTLLVSWQRVDQQKARLPRRISALARAAAIRAHNGLRTEQVDWAARQRSSAVSACARFSRHTSGVIAPAFLRRSPPQLLTQSQGRQYSKAPPSVARTGLGDR